MINIDLIKKYHKEGFLLIEKLFTQEEVDLMVEEVSTLLKDDGPRHVKESNGEIRTYYGAHQVNDIYKKFRVCKNF